MNEATKEGADCALQLAGGLAIVGEWFFLRIQGDLFPLLEAAAALPPTKQRLVMAGIVLTSLALASCCRTKTSPWQCLREDFAGTLTGIAFPWVLCVAKLLGLGVVLRTDVQEAITAIGSWILALHRLYLRVVLQGLARS